MKNTTPIIQSERCYLCGDTLISIPQVVRFSVSSQEVFPGVVNITKGLLTHFYPQFDYASNRFMVIDLHTATLAKGQTEEQLKFLREIYTKTRGDSRGSFNEFRFWRQVEPGNARGVWLLLFYEAVAFVVMHERV